LLVCKHVGLRCEFCQILFSRLQLLAFLNDALANVGYVAGCPV